MNPKRFRSIVRREINTLRRETLISAEQHSALLQRYPATRWDWSSLGRWFLFFGALSCAAGFTILGARIFEPTLENLAMGLVVGITGVFYGATRLGQRGLTWSRRSLELLGGLGIIGLTFTLGLIFSSGSGNWPMLLLIDLLVLIPLAYALRNVLLLTLSIIVFFTWFGGVTGYVSGWGAYFFGMNYPVRFLLVGLLMIGFAMAHRGAETRLLRRYEGFFKVWLSGGVFSRRWRFGLRLCLATSGKSAAGTGNLPESSSCLICSGLVSMPSPWLPAPDFSSACSGAMPSRFSSSRATPCISGKLPATSDPCCPRFSPA